MTDDNKKNGQPENENIKFDAEPVAETDNMDEDADLQMPEGFPDMDADLMDAGMLGQVQEMMGKLQKADELEKENADLKNRLGRLAADFEGYRNRTGIETAEAEGKGVSKAAEALMPVYDDVERALTAGVDDPAKLIPGVQAIQSKVLSIFSTLGLEATGREGETFDPQWHEAIQVVPGDEDDKIVTTYQLGFKMGDRLVRPARVVVSRKG